LKRKISFVLALILIFTPAIPLNGYAAEMDQGLENAIKTAKTIFKIPDDYKFDSSINVMGNKTYYHLEWSKKVDLDTISIKVAADEDGVITSYSKYTPEDYKTVSKLPKFSRQEAKAKADEYIEVIAPGLLKSLKYDQPVETSIMDPSYYFTYHRVVNGVPFYNDFVNVVVSSETGELQEYYRLWTDDLVFPGVKNVISVEEAQKAYAANLGLRLTYKTSYSDDGIKAYLVYSPKYNNNYYGIDAFTGEKVRLDRDIVIYGAGTANAKEMLATMDARQGVELTPDELAAVQKAGKLISLEKAEEIARTSKFLNITPEYKRQSYYLGTRWFDKEEYAWSLQFVKPKEQGKGEDYISVSINAKTGVITSFYMSGIDAHGAAPRYGFETVKKNVEAFLAEYYPDYLKKVEYDDTYDEDYRGTSSESYYLNYIRLVNGAVYPDNGIQVTYDNINGKITGFNLNWYNISFPSAARVISADEAHMKLFEQVGMGLEYRYKHVEFSGIDPWDEKQLKTEVVPVYTLKPGKQPYDVDANTGELVDYGGKPYKPPIKIEYTDIEGHYAEDEIKVLAEYGIYLEGTEFKPSAKIKQKEFLSLLSKTLNSYRPLITSSSTDEEIEEMYAYLQRQGVIKAGEKSPDGAVTREEAVKFIIRAMNFDKVADIKGIFICSFKDRAKIDDNLLGYVTIASGLGIVSGSGGNFRPKDNLTRAEAIVMIYNYLRA